MRKAVWRIGSYITVPSSSLTNPSFITPPPNAVMSRHRIKDVDYDDDDFYDDDDELADPEEQEFLQQCTTAVLQQLRAGQPSVTATKEEVQDALWHYYNDIDKSVNYLRGMLNLR